MTAEELRAFNDAVLDDGRLWVEPLRLRTMTPAGMVGDGRLTGAGLVRRRCWLKRHTAVSRVRGRFAQPLAGCDQVLGQHLHVGEHRHEVRVARPARDDVLVQVTGDRATGDGAEIPADVEGVGPIQPPSASIARVVSAWISATSSGRDPQLGDMPERGRPSDGPTRTGTCSGARTHGRHGRREAPLAERALGLVAEDAASPHRLPRRTRAATAPRASPSRGRALAMVARELVANAVTELR